MNENASGDETEVLQLGPTRAGSARQGSTVVEHVPGEQDAWVLATAPRAVAYATALLRNRDRAEDVVQDCYCRLLSKANDYDLPNDGLKLLLKAISHACINARTRQRRFWSLSGGRGSGKQGDFDIVDRAAQEPERQMMNAELAVAIGRGLAALPVRQGAALHLKSQGHSLQEIGEILDVSANHAAVLVHRAREAMKGRLADFLEGRVS